MPITVATAPLKVAPAPAPATMPPASSRARLGSQTATVTAARPATSSAIPRPSSRRSETRASRIWLTAAAPNTANAVTPASACDRSCSVPARKLGASEVNRPNTENITAAVAPAAQNAGRLAGGTLTRWGR